MTMPRGRLLVVVFQTQVILDLKKIPLSIYMETLTIQTELSPVRLEELILTMVVGVTDTRRMTLSLLRMEQRDYL